jgi:hypothetical protein
MAKAKKVKISIFKNGEEIRYRIVLEKHLQAQFEDMYDMSGGLWNGKDEFTVKIVDVPSMKYQNIYITNDEEIKEGDWFVNLISKELLRCFRNSAVKSLGGKTINNTEKWLDNNKCKKIILTTNTNLINDGVQAIEYSTKVRKAISQ